MSPWRSSVVAALAAALLTVGWFLLTKQRRVDEITRLREANRKLRIERPTPAFPTAPTVGSVSVGVPRGTGTPTTPGRSADTDYRNDGNATPQAALQTFAWACDRMDTELLARLIYFDPAARAKAETFMSGLPGKMRAEWRTPEELAAISFADAMQMSRFPRAVVLEKAEVEQVSADRVVLHLNGAAKERTEYQHTESGWKYVITEAMTDRFLANASAKQEK